MKKVKQMWVCWKYRRRWRRMHFAYKKTDK